MLKIIWGDITNINGLDVIINSANGSLMGGGGVDGAIHNKAGGKLRTACRALNGCKTGEAKMTKGFNLDAKFIIHTVGPVYYYEEPGARKAYGYDPEEKLRESYTNSLKIAKNNQLYKIAIPSISTGVFCYPIEDASLIALDAVHSFLSENPGYEVSLVLYNETDYNQYLNKLEELKHIPFETEIMPISHGSLSDSLKSYAEFINNDATYPEYKESKGFISMLMGLFKR